MSALALMLVEMHQKTQNKIPSINSEKLIGKINEVLHRGIILVAHEDNKIVGSIGGMAVCDWWSDEQHLSDLWFYVTPDARKSRAAHLLATDFINIANEAKIPVRLGHVFSGDSDRKDKFFERLGLIKAGSLYVEN